MCLNLAFVVVYSRSMCLSSYYLLIPSRPYPLKGGPLISSYLGSTWESLGPQVTSSVSFTPFCPLPSLYSHGSLRGCQLIRFPSPTCCCVPRPFQRLEGLVLLLYCSPECLLKP